MGGFFMKKRMVVFLLAMVISISAIAGCGTKEESTNSYNDTEETCADTAVEGYYTAPETSTEYEPVSEYVESATQSEWYNEPAQSNKSFRYETNTDAANETYTVNEENGFKSVSSAPLSTFAADVDTASYSNMRRFVNDGYGLGDFPEGSIRAEELINYFKYDYSSPKKGDRFAVDATISDCPWNKDNMLMILGVNTKTLDENKKPASNIVFLLDVSGSMNNYNKLPLLKEAMELLVENLDENDKVSIVTYASGTNVVLEGADGDQKRQINKKFEDLEAGGATNGEGGLELAYEIAEEYFIKGGNNRVILATDGDFNVGKRSGSDLEELISEKKDSGVFLSVLGFGMGNYNDTTAETLADCGNGNYSYIDSLEEAERVLVDEFGSTLYTIAKDTKLQVEFNPAMVSGYRLVGYENRALSDADFTDDTKDGGELGAGHQVTAVYEIELAASSKENGNLKYQDSVISDKGLSKDEWCTLSIAYKDPDKDESKYLEFPIGAENYTAKPNDDFIFATSVAEYAMALTDSEYLVDMNREEAIEQAIKNVKMIDPDDNYRQEFLELMERVVGNRSEGLWYE